MYFYVLLYNSNGIERIMRRRVCDPGKVAGFHQSLLENALRGSAGCVHLSVKAEQSIHNGQNSFVSQIPPLLKFCLESAHSPPKFLGFIFYLSLC